MASLVARQCSRAFDAHVKLSRHSLKATCLSILAKHGSSFEDRFCHWVTRRAALAVTLTFSSFSGLPDLWRYCVLADWLRSCQILQNMVCRILISRCRPKRRNMTPINQYQLVQDLYPSTVVHDHLVSSRFTLYHASVFVFAGEVLED